MGFGAFQAFVLLALTFALFAVELWALVDAAVRPAPAYPAAGKRTKPFWLALTGVAAVIGLLTLPPLNALSPFGIFNLAALVVAGVYLADVRPAVRGYGGRRGPRAARRGDTFGGW